MLDVSAELGSSTVGIGSVLISNLAEAYFLPLPTFPQTIADLSRSHEQSLIGALFQTSIQFAGTIGVCLCSLVQTLVTNSTGDLRFALQSAFWMLAGFAWLCECGVCERGVET